MSSSFCESIISINQRGFCCRSCWAKFFCSGGCNANSFIYEGDVKKPYKIACEMQKKRLECAIALAADRAVKGHEAPSMSEAPASMG